MNPKDRRGRCFQFALSALTQIHADLPDVAMADDIRLVMGIDERIEVGNQAHAWVEVVLDGDTYAVDPTLSDEPVPILDYYALGRTAIQRWTPEGLLGPAWKRWDAFREGNGVAT